MVDLYGAALVYPIFSFTPFQTLYMSRIGLTSAQIGDTTISLGFALQMVSP